MYIPSMSASQTSSMVTLSALSKIAIFCDFLGSSTLFSCIGEGITVRGVVSFGFGLGVFTMNNVSIISSFNLQQPKCYKFSIATQYNQPKRCTICNLPSQVKEVHENQMQIQYNIGKNRK